MHRREQEMPHLISEHFPTVVDDCDHKLEELRLFVRCPFQQIQRVFNYSVDILLLRLFHSVHHKDYLAQTGCFEDIVLLHPNVSA